ncbi:discoidin domain-containing protein, partial [Paenibacillus graminis]|nr:pyridine nucleotide-disulfide oxidoreductase [Paenibacillus graminis]
ALSSRLGITPRELYERHLAELRQTLLRQDASVIGLRSSDEADLARRARVSASSVQTALELAQPGAACRLLHDVAVLFPADPGISGFDLLLDAEQAAEVTVELWDTGRGENYVPHTLQARAAALAEAGQRQWVAFDLQWQPENPQNAFVIIKANPAVSLYHSLEPHSGVLAFFKDEQPHVSKDLEDHSTDQLVVLWKMKGQARRPFCFRLGSPTAAFAPAKALNGYHRPYGGPQQWMSEPMKDGRAEWLQLDWDSEQTFGEILLTFNDDVNEDLVNLHHHRTAFAIIPELVRNYRVEALGAGGVWTEIAAGTGNRKRKAVHLLPEPVQARSLRVIIESTNGSRHAELIEIRAYGGTQ